MGSICTWNPFNFIKADADSNWWQVHDSVYDDP